MGLIGKLFDKTGRRSSLEEARKATAEVKRSLDVQTNNKGSHGPPVYSNIKSQGRIMVFDDETFTFKMVHDDLQVPDSPSTNSINSITSDGRRSLKLNEDSFDFKLAKLQHPSI